jgi:hypothetical protein
MVYPFGASRVIGIDAMGQHFAKCIAWGELGQHFCICGPKD